MESISQIDGVSEFYYHESATGTAFAVDHRNKLTLIGGRKNTTIVDLAADPGNVYMQVPLKAPFKWEVTNYEWDPTINMRENARYLQTRNKVIELVSLRHPDFCTTLSGHKREISDAKWATHKRNLIASTSIDQSILLWNTDMQKPVMNITSLGDPSCLAWHKMKENLFAVACNSDIRIYDIRKSNMAYKYFTSAHSKKIYSLDWCSTREILLSSSRDGTVKLWDPNMLHQRLMQKKLDDFPNWKAKFTPYGLCFAVIPTNNSLPYGVIPSPPNNTFANMYSSAGNSALMPGQSSFGKNAVDSYLLDPTTNPGGGGMNVNLVYNPCLLICQATSLDQAKIFKYVSYKMNTILDFDFYLQEDKCSVITWSHDQHLAVCNLELQQLASERSASSQANMKATRAEDEESLGKMGQASLHHSLAGQIQPLTSNSSRKSSISEFGYGTPPTANASLSIVSSRTIVNERDSYTQSDDHTATAETKTGAVAVASSITNTLNLLKSSSGALFPNYEPSSPGVMRTVDRQIVPHAKTFAAKFSGLPQQMLIFRNEDFTYDPKKHGLEFNLSHLKHSKRSNHSKNKMQASAKQSLCFHILDVSRLINLNKWLADSYLIVGPSLERVCDHNFATASEANRLDLAKIWEMLKFITLGNADSISLNPHDGRPWPSSVLGRPLANYLIDSCIKANDLQTAVMIVSMLKQHDMKLASDPPADLDLKEHSFNLRLLDPARTNEFDTLIKYYCELLYRWKVNIKRIELLEIVSKRPADYEPKFQCATRCVVCSTPTPNQKCNNCKTFLIYCSLCQFPVHGLSTYCVVCGHGGHYDHMIDWFKKHDDCPCACGCRCVDYS